MLIDLSGPGIMRYSRTSALLHRFVTNAQGKVIRKGTIYAAAEHGLRPDQIDRDALWAIRRLNEAGHQAYVVGGAVRDLLLGETPKDFDIATDASPSRLRRIFRRARIIGRRFRLVHLYFQGGKILEVSTFRAEAAGENNAYGTLAEDALRRDFSVNALFYCPLKGHLIDYVGGFRDIQHRRLRILSPASVSFVEDPVRMLRAVKYAAPHQLRVPLRLHLAIRRHRRRLLDCSRERLTEEYFKILGSGQSGVIMDMAWKMGMFHLLWPRVAERCKEQGWNDSLLRGRLLTLDARVATGEAVDRGSMVAAFYQDLVPEIERGSIAAIQEALRAAAEPMKLSIRDLRSAATEIHVPPSAPPKKKRRRRRRRPEADGQRSVSMRLNNESTLTANPASSAVRASMRKRADAS